MTSCGGEGTSKRLWAFFFLYFFPSFPIRSWVKIPSGFR